MQTVPPHVRRGLLRLYFVVAVPWVAWFGLQLIEAYASHDRYYRQVHEGRIFRSMLAVPVGAPLVCLIVVWIVDGFRKPTARRDDPQLGSPCRSSVDYYPLIARAVAKLDDNSPLARVAVYGRARRALTAQLRAQEPSTAEPRIAQERRALEEAIRRVEDEAPARRAQTTPRLQTKPSTALLALSIFLFPQLWLIDPTLMSLYWVARLPSNGGREQP